MAEYCVKSGRIPPKSEWLAAMHLQEAGSTFAHNIPRVTKTVAHINFSISMQLKCQKILKFHKNTKFVI